MMQDTTKLKKIIGKALQSAQQEMVLTLPHSLLLAFNHQAHTLDIDPETDQPFASFYRWLLLPHPHGCGLCASQYLDAEDIIRQLEKNRERLLEEQRGPVDALITDLVTGHGAKQKTGPNKKDKNVISVGTNGNSDTVRDKSRSAATLASRLAESTDPAHQAAWHGFLAGTHPSVTAAALASGLIKQSHTPLQRLKQYWKRASAEERQAFLTWLEDTPHA